MSKLLGEGALLVFLDIDEARQAEIDRWYVEEHFPERISEVGYLRARRYRALEGSPMYMGLMEARSPSALCGEGYRRVTASPSDRTKSMRGIFKRAVRSTHRVIATRSRATGSVMICIRLTFGTVPARQSLETWAATHVDRLGQAFPQILSFHVLASAREVREEMDKLRPTGQTDEWPDSMLLVEVGRHSDFDGPLRHALGLESLREAGLVADEVSQSAYQLIFELGQQHLWWDQSANGDLSCRADLPTPTTTGFAA